MPNDNAPDWDEIVERYATRVFRIAFRILGTVHDAEDISQLVFSELFRMSREKPVRDWTGLVVRMTTLRAIDHLRSRQHVVELSERLVATSSDPAQSMIAVELADWLRDSLCRLPKQQVEVFSLIYFEEMDRHEVADLLGISPEAVSAALFKARQNLMTQFRVVSGEH